MPVPVYLMPAARRCSGCETATASALLWLRNRNGDGVFDKNQTLIAGGERAGVMRSTWNKLASAVCIEFYANRRRVKVTPHGLSLPLQWFQESETR